MNLKKFAGTATLTGALGAAALGLGAGAVQAQPDDRDPGLIPGDTDFTAPPGHIGQDLGVPPGQLKQLETVEVELEDGTLVEIDNPFFGVPPGHWDDVDFEGAQDDAATDDEATEDEADVDGGDVAEDETTEDEATEAEAP